MFGYRADQHVSTHITQENPNPNAAQKTGRETYSTKQKQNNRPQPPNPTNNRTPKNPPRRGDTRISCLFRDMPRCIKPNQHTGGSQIRQAPVPARGRAGAVVGCHECFVGGAEAPGLGCADGEPDYV